MLPLALGACDLLRPPIPPEEATQTRAEICRSSCNRDSNICGDKTANHLESASEAWNDTGLGASAVCREDLERCLKACPKQ